MIGGTDYGDTQFNRVTQAKGNLGQLFKLFVYLASGRTKELVLPNDKIIDSKIDIEGWSPKNYKNEYIGEVTIKRHFQNL